MKLPVATAPVKQAPPEGRANAPAPQPYPFPVGVYESATQDFTRTLTPTAAPQKFDVYNITPTGWIRGAWFEFDCVTAGNAAATAFTANGPWITVQKVTFFDLGSREVIGPIDGYDWMTLNKYGGYFNQIDPRADSNYVATTGAGATGGSFHFTLYLPIEIVHRDALGTVQNESKPGWKVEVWLNSSTAIYATAPTALAAVTMTVFPDSYTEPQAMAPGGRPYAQTPPLPGTLQYWRSENQVMTASVLFDVTNGIGFPIRNIIYKFTDSAGVRANGETNWPNPAELTYGNVNLFTLSLQQLKVRTSRAFFLTNATNDAALGREAGVFPWWYTQDMTNSPGDELRYKYLQTMVNTVLRLQGTAGASGYSLFALTNWVKPRDSSYFSLLPGAGR